MSDDLTEAVEAAELAIRGKMREREGVADGDYVRVPTHSEVRAGLEAARPLMPDAQAVARVRALCAANTEPRAQTLITPRAILRALEGTDQKGKST